MLSRSLFISLFVICELAGFVTSAYDSCAWTKSRVSDRDRKSPSRIRAWETCIFKYIKKAYMQKRYSSPTPPPGKENALNSERNKLDLQLNILDVKITSVSVSNEQKIVYLRGSIKKSWVDTRLQWTPSTYSGREYVRLRTYYVQRAIWTPQMGKMKRLLSDYKLRDKMNIDEAASTYGEVPTIKFDGNVTTRKYLSEQARDFNFDYSKFPYDDQYICFPMAFDESTIQPQRIQINLPKSITVSKTIRKNIGKNQRHYWKYERTDVSLLPKTNPGIKICLHLRRYSPMARQEIVLPLIIACLLAMAAPLFGSTRYQVVVKTLALYLQYGCLKDFINITKDIRFGDRVPNIFIFEEFAMITTAVSLVASLILWSFQRKPSSLPLPHAFTEICEKINKICCCTTFPSDDVDVESLIQTHSKDQKETTGTPQNMQLSHKWESCMQGINNILFMLFSAIYIFGFFVLLS